MKKFTAFLLVTASLLVVGCSKADLPAQQIDPEQFMQTNQQAQVSYTDFFAGNYIIQTNNGYAVIEGWGGRIPRDFDIIYGNFRFSGVTTIYNRPGNYFTRGRVIANWLTWSEAWYILTQMSDR